MVFQLGMPARLFIKKWMWAAEVAGVASLMAASGYTGYRFEKAAYQEHLAKDAKAKAKHETKLREQDHATSTISTKARDHLDSSLQGTRKVTEGLQGKVGYYLPPRPDRDATGLAVRPAVGGDPALSVGFVRLHDYAALGIDPPVAPGSSEPLLASSGVGVPALAHTLIGNYGVCHGYLKEVEEWRAWYVSEQREWDKWQTAGK